MNPFEYIKLLYEIDPEAFNEGFEEFCLKLKETCLRFSREHVIETPYTAGFKFASSIAFDQINFVIKESLKETVEEENQKEIKLRLEKMYNI